MQIKDLQPQLVWRYFDEITQIPRPSKKEEKIRAYLRETGKKLGLETKEDAIGNILITKSASVGCENAPIVILQSHMDMVCEKNRETVHDFENDPIKTLIEGEWVRADGTTLGADNGIGMAATLAALADNTLVHGKIEALFTVDEETGLTGANSIEAGFFTGSVLLNLDSEDEAELFIGCAGGGDTLATFTYSPTLTPETYHYLQIEVKQLQGGHSGCDIHKGLGNANKILNRFLWETAKSQDIVLASFDGGNLRNAIPREASAVIGVHQSAKEKIRVALNLYISTIEAELKEVEPNIKITLSSTEQPNHCIDRETTKALLNALYACPHGIIAMSRSMPELVQTSTNLASVKMVGENKIQISTSQRSSVESEKRDIMNQVESVFTLAGATVSHGAGYPGWNPNLNSAILKTAIATYENLYQITPAVKAIHAGLECGLFLAKYSHLDMISFGPTLRGVHSPDEKMHIPAVDKFWNHLKAILEALAKQ